MTRDSENVSRNGTQEPSNYPRKSLNALLESAEKRYAENIEEKGDDTAWLEDEARWHIWKACDELFQARDHAHYEKYSPAMRHFGDALNHMVMAIDIVRLERAVEEVTVE